MDLFMIGIGTTLTGSVLMYFGHKKEKQMHKLSSARDLSIDQNKIESGYGFIHGTMTAKTYDGKIPTYIATKKNHELLYDRKHMNSDGHTYFTRVVETSQAAAPVYLGTCSITDIGIDPMSLQNMDLPWHLESTKYTPNQSSDVNVNVNSSLLCENKKLIGHNERTYAVNNNVNMLAIGHYNHKNKTLTPEESSCTMNMPQYLHKVRNDADRSSFWGTVMFAGGILASFYGIKIENNK